MKTTAPRSLPHVWARFYSLRVGDSFFLGKACVVKTNFLFARASGDYYGGLKFVAPWRRVRTTKLVRDAKAGGKINWTAKEGCPTPEEIQSGVEVVAVQPHSDNGVTGPTS